MAIVGSIGVAGYMGSGKSTVVKALSARGGVAVDADSEAKKLMNSDPAIRQQLAATFGKDVLGHEGVRFDILGRRAYESLDHLVRLNGIVHPPLLRVLADRLAQMHGDHGILDAALIPLWGIEEWFDVVCWVDAAREVRFDRLAANLRLPAHELRRRMRMQEELFAVPRGSRWVYIPNSGSLNTLVDILESEHLSGLSGLFGQNEGTVP